MRERSAREGGVAHRRESGYSNDDLEGGNKGGKEREGKGREGRKEGRKERRKEGKEGRKERRKERKEGWKERRMGGKKEGRKE